MYIYERKSSGSQFRANEQPITFPPTEHKFHYPDRIVSEFLGRGRTSSNYLWTDEGLGQLTTDELSKKLKHFSFLPHFVEVGGKDVPLTPSAMNPGIYDGAEKYKIAPRLQECLQAVL